MAAEYSEETLKALREAFKAKDVDKSGTLDADELEQCLLLVGLVATEEDIKFLTKHFDTNGDGKLQVDELLDNIHIINTHIQHREDLMAAFKVFDRKGEGYIRLPHLLKILTANNFMPVDDARKLLTTLVKKYDKNGDGKFNYAEFVEIFADKALDCML